MKNEDVIVCVYQLRIAVVGRSAVSLEPPLRGDGPIETTII
jgi:hypothetical protein